MTHSMLERDLELPLAEAGIENEINAHQNRIRARRRSRTAKAADQDRRLGRSDMSAWELGVMLTGGGGVPRCFSLRHPQLHALQLASVRAGGLLRVSHAVPCRHQVELAGPDDLLGAQAVAVKDLASCWTLPVARAIPGVLSRWRAAP
jgi:hypothetical protein